MHLLTKLLAVGLGCASFTVAAQQTGQVTVNPQLQAEMKDVAVHSKVVLVADYKGKAKDFHADSSTSTLEIVQLKDKSDGSSHVSPNGEVIFVQPGAPDSQMQALFTTAFYRKAKLRLSATPQTHSVPATAATTPAHP